MNECLKKFLKKIYYRFRLNIKQRLPVSRSLICAFDARVRVTQIIESDLLLVLSGLHFLGGNAVLADAVRSAHLLHSLNVLGLEVDKALVEALNLRLNHELGHGVLVVGV